MEVSTMASRTTLDTPMLAPHRTLKRNLNTSRSVSVKASSLASNFTSRFGGGGGGSVSSDFSGQTIRPASFDHSSFSPASPAKRNVVAMVIPFVRGSARDQPPPDLASYLFSNRIVYLGMPLVPSVTELLVAEFWYLQYEDAKKPIYFYINSTGTSQGRQKLAHETEAFAIYDIMRYVEAPIFTLCVGNAWGEAALLLASGAKGNRSALPSANIMLREPIGGFEGQATDVHIARKQIKKIKSDLVKLMAKHMGKSLDQIGEDIKLPKYFTPSEAVEYGIIDKVLYNERGRKDHGVVAELKKSQLI